MGQSRTRDRVSDGAGRTWAAHRRNALLRGGNKRSIARTIARGQDAHNGLRGKHSAISNQRSAGDDDRSAESQALKAQSMPEA
jgi:hypothetical protein